MTEKSILEKALLQVESLEEAMKANAKGILASTMKGDLKDLLKEQEDEDEPDDETSPEETPTDDVPDETGDEDGGNNEIESSDDEEIPDEESTDDIETLPPGDEEEIPNEFDDEEEEDVVDMSGASEEEVLKVFKAMGPDDGIIVKKDGDAVELKTNDDEYIIKLNAGETEFPEDNFGEKDPEDDFDTEMQEQEFDDESNFPSETNYEDEEAIYEIDLDDEDEFSNDKTEIPQDTDEAARTKWNPHGDKGPAKRAGIKSKKVFKAGSDSGINEDFVKIKKQNEEYKKALILFKEKLNEVAVFNANLALANRLFIEHSTTKNEKLNILKRFDSSSTLNESKKLYKTIKIELENKKPISETVVEKITSAPKTSSSDKVLSESKAYENPEFKRIKELMRKIK